MAGLHFDVSSILIQYSVAFAPDLPRSLQISASQGLTDAAHATGHATCYPSSAASVSLHVAEERFLQSRLGDAGVWAICQAKYQERVDVYAIRKGGDLFRQGPYPPNH